MDFDANYYSNTSILLKQSDKNQRIKWDKKQREALFKSCEVMKKAVYRTINKNKGIIYPDEERYKGLVEVIEKMAVCIAAIC